MLAAHKKSSFEYLGYPTFAATFILAMALHVMAWFGWLMMPHIKIIDVPVHTINIRLGDDNVNFIQEEESNPQPVSDNPEQLESAIAKFVRQPAPKKTTRKIRKPSVKRRANVKIKKSPKIHSPSNNINSPRQFVRAMPAKFASQNYGSKLGNSTSRSAEVKTRYEQLISLWIRKFKIYPEIARARIMQGKTVVRIRIDRRGNIRYSALEYSTGYEELDHAALDMVRRANPVPAVPNSYPSGELFEFLIPVKYQIQ